jgi:hypothetical protein
VVELVGIGAGELSGCNVPVELSSPTFELLKREVLVAAVAAHTFLGTFTVVGIGVCVGDAHRLLLKGSSIMVSPLPSCPDRMLIV